VGQAKQRIAGYFISTRRPPQRPPPHADGAPPHVVLLRGNQLQQLLQEERLARVGIHVARAFDGPKVLVVETGQRVQQRALA
jgi:hypothetical protein